MMRRLVSESMRDAAVVSLARKIVASCIPRDRDCHAESIRSFLDDHFLFVSDPRGMELLSTPRYMVDSIERSGYAQGDCDEAATLAASLGRAVGLQARFVLLGWGPAPTRLSHVYTVLRGRAQWHNVDVTMPSRPVPPSSRRSVVEV